MSSPVLPLTGTTLSQNLGIPVSGGNPSSYVRAAGNGSTPSTHLDWQPLLISLMIETKVSHTLGISVGNLVESVHAVGRNNISPTLPD